MSLVTLAKYKRAIGETGSSNDTMHQEALDDASAAVLAYSDRDFGVEEDDEDRTYEYDGSGYLEIDDAAEVTAVRYEATTAALSTNLWEAKVDGPAGSAYSYIVLPKRGYATVSGEMGFAYNLDRFLLRGGSPVLPKIVVSATWGWETVPNDVQRAVIWTAKAFEAADGASGDLASESVAEVARSYAVAGLQLAEQGDIDIPARAKGILDNYRRHVL